MLAGAVWTRFNFATYFLSQCEVTLQVKLKKQKMKNGKVLEKIQSNPIKKNESSWFWSLLTDDSKTTVESEFVASPLCITHKTSKRKLNLNFSRLLLHDVLKLSTNTP
jgi:hypothetical protein